LHLQVFNRWRCITHDCGSYNFNQLVRHEIPTCDITTEETVGVIKPKTFGGKNGDLGRAFIPDHQESIRQKQKDESKITKWLVYRTRRIREIYRYNRNKNANYYQAVPFNKREKGKGR